MRKSMIHFYGIQQMKTNFKQELLASLKCTQRQYCLGQGQQSFTRGSEIGVCIKNIQTSPYHSLHALAQPNNF